MLGSILAGVYAATLVLPNGALLPPAVRGGIDQALAVVETLTADVARLLAQSVYQAFDGAYFTALAVNAALLTALAVMAWRARAVRHPPVDAERVVTDPGV